MLVTPPVRRAPREPLAPHQPLRTATRITTEGNGEV